MLFSFRARNSAITVSILLAVLLLGLSCSDDIVNNYYLSDKGSISGFTDPIVSNAVISILDGPIIAETNDGGYFRVDTLEPGIYDIVVEASGYSTRTLHGIVVEAGQNNRMNIKLSNYPAPVYSTYPADGDVNIRNISYFRIYSDFRLNTDDLSSLSLITPSINIINVVESESKNGDFQYVVNLGDRFIYGMTYNIKLDKSIRTFAGHELGKDIEFSFSTNPISVSVLMENSGIFGNISVEEFHPIIRFNESVDLDLFSEAIHFDPPIEGIWFPYQNYIFPEVSSSRSFIFFPTELPLLGETDYVMVISNDMPLFDSAKLPFPDSTFFQTEPYGLESISPRNGSFGVNSKTYVSLIFNFDMNESSVESAFSFSDSNDEIVEGSFEWIEQNRYLRFHPTEDLKSGEVYKIILTADAKLITDVNITHEYESFFLVR